MTEMEKHGTVVVASQLEIRLNFEDNDTRVSADLPSKTTMMSVAEIPTCVNAFALQKLFNDH